MKIYFSLNKSKATVQQLNSTVNQRVMIKWLMREGIFFTPPEGPRGRMPHGSELTTPSRIQLKPLKQDEA